MEDSVANTILKQLGGQQFIAMTGSKNFVSDGNTLCMELVENHSKANRLWITLDADDTYTMRFFYYKPSRLKTDRKNGFSYFTDEEIKEVKTISGVYCDKLQSIFTDITWLLTSL